MRKPNASTKLVRTFTALTLWCVSISLLVSAAEVRPVMKTVVPTEIEDPLPNPYMGWGIWAGPRGFGNNEKVYTLEQNTNGFGDDAPPFNWVLIDWDWASLEPKEGQFYWNDFDAVINYWAARHKQFVLRFWVTDDAGWSGRPGVPVLPDWIWMKGMRYREYTGNGGVKQRELDYAAPSYEKTYLPVLRKFLTAFAERYDKPDTPFIFLQVMGYGHWADWDGNQMRSLEEHMYTKALDVAASNGFGLIWTGFIDGLRGWDGALMKKYWPQNPIIAEGNWNYDDMADQRTHGTLDENLDLMRHWHSNFAHFYLVVETYRRAMSPRPRIL